MAAYTEMVVEDSNLDFKLSNRFKQIALNGFRKINNKVFSKNEEQEGVHRDGLFIVTMNGINGGGERNCTRAFNGKNEPKESCESCSRRYN